ncbi:MAG: YcxB family protein [Sphingobacteriaceae bacterium]|nr:YcxB family protein [Sphingobacteriaceae bacterium]
MHTLQRKEKISMFLHDYYFGYGNLIKLLRLLGGPALVLIGLHLFEQGLDKATVAYAGFCILYGIYMLLKPYLWILFRLDQYKTEAVEIKIEDNSLLLKDALNESKIDFSSFKTIQERPNYFVLVVSKSVRLRIPKSLLSMEDQEKITFHIHGKS